MQDTGRILLPDGSLQELYGIAINEVVHSTVDLLSLSLSHLIHGLFFSIFPHCQFGLLASSLAGLLVCLHILIQLTSYFSILVYTFRDFPREA